MEGRKTCALWCLQVVGLLIFLVLCIFLSLRPKSPTYTVVDFSIPASNCGVSEECANTTLQYALEIRNPNKDSDIYYGDIYVTFYYGQDAVGKNTIPSFHQGKKKKKKVTTNVDIDSLAWGKLYSAMMNATSKQPQLNADVLTNVKYKTWGVSSKHHGMHRHGSFVVGKDGRIPGKKKIKLHASKKRLIS